MSAAGGSVAAVDLGATSGRVILGHVGPGEVHLEQVARFRNGPVRIGDALHWDVLGLWQDALAGLAAAVHSRPEVLSVGVDSWAVDYGLLRGGRLLGNPRHYRDERNPPAAEAVHQLVSPAELYTRNGLQFLPFNTLYQLYAEQTEGMLPLADRLLLIPDLLTYWLSGIEAAEATNASATGLLGVRDAVWDAELIERFGLRQAVFSEVVAPGTELGALDPQMAVELGRDLRVVTVGSHDTASAVVAVPASDDDFAYVSCGTWALVGVETERPVLTEGSRLAGFTNERGVDGRIRYLHNVMGLWLLNELVREWETTGEKVSLSNLLAQAEAVTAPVAVFDPDDASFMAPGPMPPPHRSPLPRARPAGADQPRRERTQHRGEPGRGLRSHRARGGPALGQAGAGDPHRRRRRAERVAVPAHRRPIGTAGTCWPGRGDRHRQRARASPHTRPDRWWTRRTPARGRGGIPTTSLRSASSVLASSLPEFAAAEARSGVISRGGRPIRWSRAR